MNSQSSFQECLPSPECACKQIINSWAVYGVTVELDNHGKVVLYGPPIAGEINDSPDASYLWNHPEIVKHHIFRQLVARTKAGKPDPIWGTE